MLLQKQHLPTSVLLLACGPITWDLDAGGSGIQGHPWLHSKIETSISYRRPYLFEKKNFFFFFFAKIYVLCKWACCVLFGSFALREFRLLSVPSIKLSGVGEKTLCYKTANTVLTVSDWVFKHWRSRVWPDLVTHTWLAAQHLGSRGRRISEF